MAEKKQTGARASGRRVVEGETGPTTDGTTGKAQPRAGESVARNVATGEPLEQRPANSAVSSSTPSQQPTGLENKGGLEQPHPTVAARAAKSGHGAPPPGRSHDSTLRQFAPPGGAGTIRVRATATGYYEHTRRREGDVFDLKPREGVVTEVIRENPDDPNSNPKLDPRTHLPLTRTVTRTITAEEQFSDRWMERVDDDEQERISTSRDAIRKAHDEMLGGRTRQEDVIGADEA